jgi:hypothetical protein
MLRPHGWVARVGWVERSETHQWTADGYDGFRLAPLPILLSVRIQVPAGATEAEMSDAVAETIMGALRK